MLDQPAVLPMSTSSRRVRQIPQALSIYVNQLVSDLKRRGENLTVLSLGEAFFDVPLFSFAERACGAAVEAERGLLVTAGSKIAIAIAMLAILDPGDELVLQEPAWLSYPEQAHICGATARFTTHDVAFDAIPSFFGPRTRLFILNNPNHPARRVYSGHELRALYRVCRERGVWLLTDEAYSDFVVDGTFTSLAEVAPDGEGAVVVNSLSKNLGISGWRTGYLISSPAFVEAALALHP